MQYYVDTCIWLNLFKKEGDPTKGKPYWKLARDFIERIMLSDGDEIIYSSVVLRELQLKLDPASYEQRRKFLADEGTFNKVDVTEEDFVDARHLESRYDFSISFCDLVHLTLARRLNMTLVTRDRQLLAIARECGVHAGTPETL